MKLDFKSGGATAGMKEGKKEHKIWQPSVGDIEAADGFVLTEDGVTVLMEDFGEYIVRGRDVVLRIAHLHTPSLAQRFSSLTLGVTSESSTSSPTRRQEPAQRIGWSRTSRHDRGPARERG